MSPEPAGATGGLPRVSADWIANRERGSTSAMRAMVFVSRRLGRRFTRTILCVIVGYFYVFAPSARRHSRKYLRRALGREPRAMDGLRHMFAFASTIHDRIYLADGRLDEFEISIDGEHWVRETFNSGRGAFLMGAHLGSFEVIGSAGRQQSGLRVAMAMYEENARKINAMLRAINPAAMPEIIELGHIEAMLRIRERLDSGVFVGMLADRSLGDEPSQAVQLLGAPARLPTGPMRMAALLRRPVIFMLGLYRGGNRYHVVFTPLADFSATAAGERDAAVAAAVARYAQLLEQYCRSAPYNWFNFYDFWRT
jgi:predicted LPLAT superfamily acyltransferase